ncbi:MAG: glycosyl transferase [Alphaproteobacteria bacterium]|nr:glycosyl transferase [Alphaproteobacteria bacterium]
MAGLFSIVPAWDAGLFLVLGFFVSFLISWKLIEVLRKHGAVDKPGERSMHTAPVPRGAGIAIVTVMVAALIWMVFKSGYDTVAICLLAGTSLVAVVSLLDDIKTLPPALRLAAHITATAAVVYVIPPDQSITGGMLHLALERTLIVIIWAGYMNIYNFMDGIDGITGVETITIALGTLLLLGGMAFNDHGLLAVVCLALIGSCFGFLCLNWHPAKIFMGDVGSVSCGYITGYFLLVLLHTSHWYVAAILPLYYLADGGITLVRRLLRGEKIWLPHRQHFYQKAALAVGHDTVVKWIMTANILLVLSAVLVVLHGPWAALLAAAVVATLLWKMHSAAKQPATHQNKA